MPPEPLDLSPQEPNAPEDMMPTQEPAGDLTELVSSLVATLQETPGLATKVADFIEHELILKGSADTVSMPESQMGQAQPASMPGAPMNQAPMQAASPMMGSQGPAGGPNPYEERLGTVESAFADMALERELGTAQEAFNAMKTHFPILPDFNANAVLKYMVDNGIPSVTKAAQMWGMEQMMQGEGTASSRILATQVQNPRSAKLPDVEGPGGNVATNSPLPPPTSLREAQARAQKRLESRFSGMPGA